MVTYERYKGDTLFVLRLVFAALVLALFLSISNRFVNLHYVIISTLILGSIIKVTTLKIYGREITVTRYFVFGLIPVKWFYDEQRNNIKIYRYYDLIDRSPTDAGTALDIVGILFFKKVKFQYLNIRPGKLIFKLGDIDVKLTDYEYELV